MAGSGCGGQGDGEAEGFQLADVVAGFLALVDAVGVVVGAQVGIAGGGVGEQVPDDHQDGAGDGDQGLELAAALDQAPVALAEEGVGLGGRGGGLAEDAFEVGVALAGLAGAGLGAGLDGARAQPGPRHQVRWGGEDAHVQPDLGEDDLRGAWADAGDLIQPRDRKSTRLNSSHVEISYAVFCLKKKKQQKNNTASKHKNLNSDRRPAWADGA